MKRPHFYGREVFCNLKLAFVTPVHHTRKVSIDFQKHRGDLLSFKMTIIVPVWLDFNHKLWYTVDFCRLIWYPFHLSMLTNGSVKRIHSVIRFNKFSFPLKGSHYVTHPNHHWWVLIHLPDLWKIRGGFIARTTISHVFLMAGSTTVSSTKLIVSNRMH